MSARVLVIDDEPAWRAMLREILAGAGYEVDVAESPAEARERLLTSAYDVITLDLHFGYREDRGGLELLGDPRLQPHLGRPAVIVLSGYVLEDSQREAFLRGAAGVLTKQEFDEDVFLSAVSLNAERSAVL